jgi:hypothetical protein
MNHKSERVILSHGIPSVLQNVRSTGFQSVITGDGLWFILYYLHGSIWASSRYEVPERVSQKIDTEKCLISRLSFVNGTHSLVDVPQDSTYHSAFFCDIVVANLFEGITVHSRRKSLNGLYIHIHLDNARPRNARRFAECLHLKRSNGYRTGLMAPTSHHVTSSALVISSENSPKRHL